MAASLDALVEIVKAQGAKPRDRSEEGLEGMSDGGGRTCCWWSAMAPVAVLTLNRPKQLNALSVALRTQMVKDGARDFRRERCARDRADGERARFLGGR